MAETGRLSLPAAPAPWVDPVTLVRIAIIVACWCSGRPIARSGLLYRDVVPSLVAIGGALVEAALDVRLLLEPRRDRRRDRHRRC